MTIVFVDTNIIVDLLAERIGFYEDASDLFSRAEKNEFNLCISALTFANTSYILSKVKSAKEARVILRRFNILVKIISLTDKIINLALSDEDFPDFEDGLQYYSAVENYADVILSRDKKHFKNSKIPILTAKEFLAQL